MLSAEQVRLRVSPEAPEVEVVWKHALASELPDHALSAGDLLFWLSDLGVDPSDAFAAWLAAAQAYRPVFDSFFATRSEQAMYEEDRFSNLTQAAEGYHRRKLGGRPDQGGHDAKVQEVLAAAPPDLRDWLDGLLRHVGEFQLSERIAGLVALHPWLVGDVIPKTATRWAKKVALARNYRTHHDPAALPVAGTTWDLLGLTQRLTVLMEACLLAEIGFGEAKVQEMIRRASRPYAILKLNKL